MEKSVEMNKIKLKSYLFIKKLDMDVGYEEFIDYVAGKGKRNTYYNRFHKGRVGNRAFRNMRALFNFDEKFDECFHFTVEQRAFFGIPTTG